VYAIALKGPVQHTLGSVIWHRRTHIDYMATIDERIQHALDSLKTAHAREAGDINAGYIGAFQSSARSKAKAVLTALKEADPPLNKLRPVFLSIGGGDGEELRGLLGQSEATLGILIEKTKEFADIARRQQDSLPQGKCIEVFEGDAQAKLPEAMEFARKKIKEEHGDFLVVSCHAVIHELYDRSERKFDLAAFLGGIFRYDEFAVWFTSREPGIPEKWPEEILLRADCRSESLLNLANVIAARHPDLRKLGPAAHIMGDDVRLHKVLAMELVAKLFYIDDLSHEIDERSTAVDHTKFQSMLMLAIGEKAFKEQRANAATVSEPTSSFQKKWQEFRIEVRGLNDSGTSLLPVAESQTRVIAWRLPIELLQQRRPELAVVSAATSVEVQYEREDLRVAAGALKSQETTLLEALCISRGRRWIESRDRTSVIPLLERIKNSHPQTSLLSCWAHYLLSLAALFSGKANLEMFSEEVEKNAASSGLTTLFRAERMEFLRKIDGRKHRAEVVEVANSLLGALDQSRLTSPSDLERYVIATTKFVVANSLRLGGLYQDAWQQMSEAENIYRPTIESHSTELAHCHYAKTVCVALTGATNFDLRIADRSAANREFASALIELAYAHAAWIVGDVTKAAQHADSAAKVFDEIDSPHYAKRARTLGWLLKAWTQETAVHQLSPPSGSEEFSVYLRVLTGPGSDLSALATWLSGQRPSNVLGLIQFAKDKANWAVPVKIRLPPTLHWDEGRKLAWRAPEEVSSLSELDSVLRGYLGIPNSRRIPLITD
jgi:hypothetical protein